MSEPPIPPAGPQPPSEPRKGCLQVLAVLIGGLMLLPGLCGITLAGLDSHEMLVDPAWMAAVAGLLAVGVAGIALIRWGIGRSRQ